MVWMARSLPDSAKQTPCKADSLTRRVVKDGIFSYGVGGFAAELVPL